ncbi:MAG: SRPBCC family protein [Cytophagaceae bacterium]|nr:SRPBCC family protein [Gemmatimonadaceae bacterium]
MPRIVAQHCAIIPATTAAVYEVLRDYEVGHPAILPPEHFSRLEIEQGGRGEGTVIRFAFTAVGATSLHRVIICEPEPGHRLVEMNPRDGTCTSFLLHAADHGAATRLTIRTELRASGARGWLMRAVLPSTLRHVYAKQARNLMTLLGTGDAMTALA